MLMNVAEITQSAEIYPELAGTRVLITGIGPDCGIDVARVFAEHGCRMILQIPNPCRKTDAFLQIIAENAEDVRAHHEPITDSEKAIRFTQKAAKLYSGIDTVINFIQLRRHDLNRMVTLEEIETFLSNRLQAASQATRVAANRMGFTRSSGSILNIMHTPSPKSGSEMALAGIARTALAALTKAEAGQWADCGVRINAVAPPSTTFAVSAGMDDCIYNEAELAQMALYLTSHKGRELSGHVLLYDRHEPGN
ncbi:MAG: SDR family oxidoreductase [Pseudomonadota bacterium]